MARVWIYRNVVHRYERVHRAECPHCRDGEGTHDAADSAVGEWIGFDSYRDAAATPATFDRSDCKVCAPG